MKGRGGGNGLTSSLLVMISFLTCFYIAGRLWQDSERRLLLVKLLDKNTEKLGKVVTVEEKLQVLSCRDVEKRLAEAQMELAAARNQGYLPGYSNNSTDQKLLAVIGIYTEFGNKLKRKAIRQKWLPTGENLKKLEVEKGIVIRFVIGRSPNRGDMSDRLIETENRETKDFLVLDEHPEVPEEAAQKAKHFFSTAVHSWDANFYIKIDDNTRIDFDEMEKILKGYLNKPRLYIGCMKSGDVITDEKQQWYEKEWWKFGDGKSYFRYANGQMYGLSRSLAQYIHVNRELLHTYANEDISVGSWMIGLDVEHVDEKQFCCSSLRKGFCTMFTLFNNVLGII